MLYYFKKGKNITETQKKVCAVYGEGAGTDRTCQKWFEKFRATDFSLDDAPQLGGPVEVDSNQIETIIENNQHHTTREIEDTLKISKSSLENHLHQLGYVNCFDVWVPHKLSEKNLLDQNYPGGAVVKNPPANAGDTGSSPWSGKIPHAVQQLSLCTTTTEPALYSLQATTTEACAPRARAPQQEKPLQ